VFMKKKKGKKTNLPVSNRQNKDEVWKSIKQFLKDNGEYGQEIVDSFVAKRHGKDYINPNDPKPIRKIKKKEIKERDRQLKLANKNNKGPKIVTPKEKELYVVCFTTKDIKTNNLNAPRAIECEVINTKIGKKQFDRKIIINGEVNYEREMEWIGPLRKIEHAKNLRAEKQRTKAIVRERKRLEKMKNKAKKAQEKREHKNVEQ
jgi:hypothetical protein